MADSQFFLFNRFYLKNGSQLGRTHDFCRDGFLPALERHCAGPKIFLQAIVADQMPEVAMLCGLESFEEYGALRFKLSGDRDFGRGFAAWEDHADPPTEHYTTSLLRTASYSPKIERTAGAGDPRVFELRTYHSPSHRQLQALHERFAGPEIAIFHRLGIRPLLYTDTEFGPDKPCLVYLTPFSSLAEREEKWHSFSTDPEWIKLKEDSALQHGQVASTIRITLFKATAYSPVR